VCRANDPRLALCVTGAHVDQASATVLSMKCRHYTKAGLREMLAEAPANTARCSLIFLVDRLFPDVVPGLCSVAARVGLVMAIRGLHALLALTLTLCGCGLARQQELKAQSAALKEQSQAAVQECEAKYPKGSPATAVVRAQCMNDAMAITRPLWGTSTDLVNGWMAHRVVVAEKLQKGQITVAQANEEMANSWTQVVDQEQRRNLANRSVTAQETAAQNIGGPTSCTRIGNTVNCY
jgi:hypothetical protein